MLKLYDYFRSSAAFRVRIALNLKGLSYESIPIHLLNNGGEQFTKEYQAINPQSLVPALQVDGKIITQSLAIIEYLDETHPGTPLLPADPYTKALVRSFALAITADIHPLNNLRVLRYLSNELKCSEDQKSKWYQHWMAKGLSALEQFLTQHKMSQEYCFGNTPTLADICLIPQLYNAKRFACDLNAYPTLVAIDTRCQQLKAFKDACPKETVA